MPMTILHLLNRIREFDIVLPAIQRDFAWPVSRTIRLFDSLMQGFPIGIVLLWETYREIQYRNFTSDLWPGQMQPVHDNTQQRKLGVVLDGQQRLQSLFCALCGTYKGKSLYLDILSGGSAAEDTRLKYDFRFMGAEEFKQCQATESSGLFGNAGVVPVRRRRQRGCRAYFLRVADLLTYCPQQKTELRKRLTAEMFLTQEDQERLEMNFYYFDEILSKNTNLLKVAVIDQNLPSNSPYRKTEADILEIFLRINREGTPLSRSDLTFSILKLNWKESAVSLPQFVREINTGNEFNLTTDFVIRCLFAVSDLGARFDPDLLRKPSMVERIRANYTKCTDAIRATLDAFVRLCGCSRSDLIGGPNTLVPFVYYLFHTKHHELPESQLKAFSKALYLFGFARTFSHSAEVRLRKFIRYELEPLAARGDTTFPFASAIWWVKYWEGFTHFDGKLLQANPPLASHVLQRLTGARAQYWRNEKEMDHIFPRSGLLRMGCDTTDIEHFANFWLLPKGKNMNKSNRPPAEYFHDVNDCELKQALIDRQLLDYSTFKAFLRKRGKMMVEAIKAQLEFTDKDFRAPLFIFKPTRLALPKIPPARAETSILPSLYSNGNTSRSGTNVR